MKLRLFKFSQSDLKKFLIDVPQLLILMLIFIATGCSSTRKTVEVPSVDFKQQNKLQRYLQKLNQNNEKLKGLVSEAIKKNEDTDKALQNSQKGKSNLPELEKMLEEYRAVNKDTNQLLTAYQADLESNIRRNQEINEMLNGLSPANQEERIGKTRDMTKHKEPKGRISYLIGLSGMSANGFVDTDDEGVSFDGTAGSFYFTIVGDNHLSIGLQHMQFHNEVSGTVEGASTEMTMNVGWQLNALKLGVRIWGVETVEFIPQILYGIGQTNISRSDQPDFESSGPVTLQGFEFPVYFDLSGFSFGVVLGGYQIAYKITKIEDSHGSKIYHESELEPTTATTLALGLIIGGAW